MQRVRKKIEESFQSIQAYFFLSSQMPLEYFTMNIHIYYKFKVLKKIPKLNYQIKTEMLI